MTSAPISRGRRIAVAVLVWVTTLLAVVAIFAVWADRQVFNADNWANTSGKLLQNEKIRNATANYLVDQLYANVDVEGELKAKLPPQLQPLAGPIAGGLQGAAVTAANRALENPKVQHVWKEANRAADKQFIAITEGRTGTVSTTGGVVSLDLSAIVSNITDRLGLPDVSSKLPPTVAHLQILKSDDLKLVQDGGDALRKLALILTILVPLLYALAIVLARGRRRKTLMTVGVAIILAGVVVFIGRGVVESETTKALVKNDANLPAAQAVLSIATTMLSEIAGAFVIIGIPLVLAAWLAGPTKLATAGRKSIAPFLRDEPVWTFVIVTGIMILIFLWEPIPATGKPAGMIVFLALALLGTEVLRRQTQREFPSSGNAKPDVEAAAT